MSLLLDAWRIIKAVPEAAGVAIEAGKAVGRLVKSFRRMPKPRVPPREESVPWSHATVDSVEAQIASSTSFKVASPRAVTERPRPIPPPKR